MSKFETLVKVLLIFCSLALHAEVKTNSNNNNNSGDAQAAADMYKELGCKANKEDPDCKSLFNAILHPSKNDCSSADEKLDTKKSEFTTACKKANIDGKCATEIAKCLQTDSSYDKGDRAPIRTRRRDPNQPLDVEGEKVKYEKCPAMAKQDLEKYEKQLKEQQEKVKKLENEIPDLQTKAQKATKDTNKDLQALTDKAQEDQDKHAEELTAAGRNKEAAENAIVKEIKALQVDISKANDRLGQLRVAKLKAQMDLRTQKRTIEFNCYKIAIDQVAAKQAEIVEKIKTGTYNRDGFAGLMKHVGVADKVEWQRKCNEGYRDCLIGKPTKDSKDGANDDYLVKVDAANTEESGVRDGIKQMQAAQLELRDNNACAQQATPQSNGGSGKDTALCKAQRNAFDDGQKADAKYRSKVDAANKKYLQTKADGDREAKTLTEQAKKKQNEIDGEKKRLDNLQRFLQAKYNAGANSSTEAGSLADAQGKFLELKSAANNVISCTEKQFKGLEGEYCENDRNCNQAKDLLKNTLEVPEDDPSMNTVKVNKVAGGPVTTPAPRAAPPPSTPTTPGAAPAASGR